MRSLHISLPCDSKRVYYPRDGARGFSYVVVHPEDGPFSNIHNGRVAHEPPYTISPFGRTILPTPEGYTSIVHPIVTVDAQEIVKEVDKRLTHRDVVVICPVVKNATLGSYSLEEEVTETFEVPEEQDPPHSVIGYKSFTVKVKPSDYFHVHWDPRKPAHVIADVINLNSPEFDQTWYFGGSVVALPELYSSVWVTGHIRISLTSINNIPFTLFDYKVVGFVQEVPPYCITFSIRKTDLLYDPDITFHAYYAGKSNRLIPVTFACYVPALHVSFKEGTKIVLRGGGERDLFKFSFDETLKDEPQDMEFSLSHEWFNAGLFPWSPPIPDPN